MGLSCGCDYEWDGESVSWFNPSGFMKMPWFDRRKKCMSCGNLINPNENVAMFDVFRGPNCKYEIKRFGEGHEIPMAPRYFCEHCSEIFFNLEDLGFCVNSAENMKDLLKEYKRDYAKTNLPENLPGGFYE